MKQKFRFLTCAFLALLFLFPAGCAREAKVKTPEPAEQSATVAGHEKDAKTEAEIPRSTKAGKNVPDAEQVLFSGVTEKLSFSEMMETSTLVVYGEVSKICEPALIEWVDGGECHVTDVEFSVQETLRGEGGETVTVRTLGGLVDGVYEDYAETPELQEGEECLLFLYQPGMGGGMNTKGDYYYLRGLSDGVYRPAMESNEAASLQEEPVLVNCREPASQLSRPETQETAEISLKDQEESPAGTVVFSLSGLKSWSEGFNRRHPVDPDYFRNTTLEAYRFNLENGTMTQEEYDRYTAQIDEYARLVPAGEKAEPAELEKQKDALRKSLQAEAG